MHSVTSNMGQIQGQQVTPPRDTLAYYKAARAVVKAKLCDVFETEVARGDEELIRVLMVTLMVPNKRPCNLTMNLDSGGGASALYGE